MVAAGKTVKVPIVGRAKSQTVYMVGGAAALVVGVAYYRAHKAKSAAAASVAAAGATTTDPATGFPYGSTEDAAALAAQAQYQTPAGSYGSGGPASTPAPGTGFTSNAQWEQAAIEYLTSTVGIDAGALSGALGKYLAGESVTENEHALITQAIAAEGQPPQAGAQGFPPSIKDIVPNAPSTAAPATPVLKVGSLSPSTAHITWTNEGTGITYHVRQDNGGYNEVASTFLDVPRGHSYSVYAFNAAGQKSGLSNTVKV